MSHPKINIFRILTFAVQHPKKFLFILQIKREKLTYLGIGALIDLASDVAEVEQNHLSGIVIETGCALGGSALVICAVKNKHRPFKIYDSFEQIPPPSSEDGQDAHHRYEQIKSGKSTGINGNIYYGYQDNLMEVVSQNFSTYGYPLLENQAELIKGYFENTLQFNEPVALAHIDCDWYESVKICLNNISPQLLVGGRMVIDDYFDWSGCKQAVDEFLSTHKADFRVDIKSRLSIVRTQ
jgi:asparagine synthase (glutamine-hydrolysing)